MELPRSVAAMLLEHLTRSPRKGAQAFLFATRTGRPLGQRNALRELRRAQERARDADGRPVFPGLFRHDDRGELEVDGRGRYVPLPRAQVPRGTVPTFHGYRHTAASVAIAEGDVEEVSWQLGHKSSVVTRSVYRHEVKGAERTARRRAKMEARYGALVEAAMEAPDGKHGATAAAADGAEVLPLRQIGDRRR